MKDPAQASFVNKLLDVLETMPSTEIATSLEMTDELSMIGSAMLAEISSLSLQFPAVQQSDLSMIEADFGSILLSLLTAVPFTASSLINPQNITPRARLPQQTPITQVTKAKRREAACDLPEETEYSMSPQVHRNLYKSAKPKADHS